MGTIQTVTDLFNSDDAADLGITGKGSQIMINNLNATTLPMCVGAPIQTLETDDVTIIMFILDDSGSMGVVRTLLIETFNEIMVEGLRGASKKTANTIVIGGLKFSRRVEPLWGGGFKKLQELPLLTTNEYQAGGGSTNLYKAMLDGVTAAGAYATQVFQETGTPPKVIVIPLTDGADNVREVSPDDVLAVTSGLSRELWKLPCAVFETGERVDGKQIAQDSGFDVFEFKQQPGETKDDVKRRFRHMMGTLSSQVISASQAQVGTPTSGNSFWT
ncbi:MAG: hypothetical protein WAV31_03635 [Candidatus Moraniibacteriota bacterium]